MADPLARLPAHGLLDPALPAHRRILAALRDHDVLGALAPFDPCVVGTFAIGLDVEGSDVDIVGEVTDAAAFVDVVRTRFGHLPGFSVRRRAGTVPGRVVARFVASGVPVEVFGQPVPVVAQAGYRHLVVEHRLLGLGGARLRAAVVDHRRRGSKTEPAFAAVLGLAGDPYAALLALADLDDGSLADVVAAWRDGSDQRP